MNQPPQPESLDSLFAQICRLKHGRVRTLLEALGLYRGQPPVLRALWEQEGLTHTELSKRLRVHSDFVGVLLLFAPVLNY